MIGLWRRLSGADLVAEALTDEQRAIRADACYAVVSAAFDLAHASRCDRASRLEVLGRAVREAEHHSSRPLHLLALRVFAEGRRLCESSRDPEGLIQERSAYWDCAAHSLGLA